MNKYFLLVVVVGVIALISLTPSHTNPAIYFKKSTYVIGDYSAKSKTTVAGSLCSVGKCIKSLSSWEREQLGVVFSRLKTGYDFHRLNKNCVISINVGGSVFSYHWGIINTSLVLHPFDISTESTSHMVVVPWNARDTQLVFVGGGIMNNFFRSMKGCAAFK